MLRLLLQLVLIASAQADSALECGMGDLESITGHRHAKGSGVENYPLTLDRLSGAEKKVGNLTQKPAADPVAGLTAELGRLSNLRSAAASERETDGIARGRKFAVFSFDFASPSPSQAEAIE